MFQTASTIFICILCMRAVFDKIPVFLKNVLHAQNPHRYRASFLLS